MSESLFRKSTRRLLEQMEGGSVGGITTVNTTVPNVASDNYDLQCNDGLLRQQVVFAGANSDLLHGQRTRQGRQEVVPGWDENYFVFHID